MVLLFALACASSDPADKADPTGDTDPTTDTDPTPTVTDTDLTTVETGDSGTTTTGLTIPTYGDVDCTAAAPLPVPTTTLSWVPGSEDFAFSADGYELGVSGGNLYATPWGGPKELRVPGLSDSIRGGRVLGDGTMAFADSEHQAIVGADPNTGASWTIAGGIVNPNGIAIGADGWIYAALTGKIVRVEPSGAAVEVVADLPANSFDGLSFSPDYKRLWFDEEAGTIWYVDFDAYNQPMPAVKQGNLPVGAFSLLDGMTVDACGNLYVVEMGGRVWRVTPYGDVDIAIEAPALAIISSINFGSGVGGWDRETLYVMDFTGKLYAAPMGIPGKWEPYLPIP